MQHVSGLARVASWRAAPPLARGLLSPAFRCQADWDRRLEPVGEGQGARVLTNMRKDMGKIFVELDKKFTLELRGSALDVDLFANAAETEGDLEQLEELLFKLRRTPHTVHTPASTHHAVVRAMLGPAGGEEHLQHIVRMLEDRTNYGLFLDRYTSVLLLDRLLEDGSLAAAARAASHLMLQEEDWRLAGVLGSLACWRYCQVRADRPWLTEDEQPVVEEEEEDPEEVHRIRVKEGPPHFGMVPNGYEDDHFDLREPDKILGKTMWYLNRSAGDPLGQSLAFLGLVLWGKEERALQLEAGHLVQEVCQEILKVADGDKVLAKINAATKVEANVDQELLSRCEETMVEEEKSSLDDQINLYSQWNREREDWIDAELRKLKRKEKLDDIAYKKEELSREEERLFFFDNQSKLDKEKEKKVDAWRKTFPKRTWPGTKGYFAHPKWLKTPGKELKTPRWEKREAKKGPAK